MPGAKSTVERFVQAISEPEIRLDLAALLIADHCRPGEVDVAAALETLDDLAAQVAGQTSKTVTDLLYSQLGFGGNRGDYYQPANSYLDQVLAKRSGIPITLAVVIIEVARRVGISLYGVGMPGHFLVGVPVGADVPVSAAGASADATAAAAETQPDLFDPFDGVYLDYDAAKAIYERLGSQAPFSPAPFSPAFLAPTPPLVMLQRILNNLRVNYLRSPQPTNLQKIKALAAVLELLVCMPNCPPADYLQLADVLNSLGSPDVGAKHLEAGAQQLQGSDAALLLKTAGRLRARLN